MDIATTVLPGRDELLRRLTEFDDDPHLVQKLYPHILRLAGQEQVGMGIALALTLAVADYAAGLPPMLAAVVQMRLPNVVNAIVDDPQVRADAIGVLQ